MEKKMQKELNFEDGSSLTFLLEDGELTITSSAAILDGDSVRYMSSSALLTKEQTENIIKWLKSGE